MSCLSKIPQTLFSARLLCRPFEEQDKEVFLDWHSDARFVQYDMDRRQGADEYPNFWHQIQDAPFEHERAWAIGVPDHPPIGYVMLWSYEDWPELLQVGFGLDPSAWGQGYAREALEILLAYAFANGVQRVEAQTDARNAKCCALLRALGFVYEGKSFHSHLVQNQWQSSLRFARFPSPHPPLLQALDGYWQHHPAASLVRMEKKEASDPRILHAYACPLTALVVEETRAYFVGQTHLPDLAQAFPPLVPSLQNTALYTGLSNGLHTAQSLCLSAPELSAMLHAYNAHVWRQDALVAVLSSSHEVLLIHALPPKPQAAIS